MKRITFLFTLMLLAFSTQGWAESRKGSDFEDEEGNWYLMLEDFEGTAPIIMGTTKEGSYQITEESGNKFMKYDFRAYDFSEYAFVQITLLNKVLSKEMFSEILFDINFNHDNFGGTTPKVKIGENDQQSSAKQIGTPLSPEKLKWETYSVSLNDLSSSYTSFYVFIGGIQKNNGVPMLVDNIRLKYKEAPSTDPVAVENVSLKSDTTITVGGSKQLVPTFTPLNATNKKVTWTSSNTGVATVDSTGTVHGIAVGTATITVKTEDGNHTASCKVTVEETSSRNGKVYFDGTNVCLMVEDFEGTEPTIKVENAKEGEGRAAIEDITVENKTTKAIHFITSSYQSNEYLTIPITLPVGKKLSDVYSDLLFNVVYDNTSNDNTYKDVKVCLNETSNNICNERWNEAPTDHWVIKSYSLSDKYTNENTFTLLVGGVQSNGMKYYIDNIRLKLASTASGTNAGDNDNIGWSYNSANKTLTFAGEGAMDDYNSSSDTPWKDIKDEITSVVVEDGITSIGNNSFSEFTNVGKITFNSPNLSQIGENVFQSINSNATITLKSNPTIANQTNKGGIFNLVLNDAEKPFMAATSGNTYNNVTYTRNYVSLYSTTILPFAPRTVDGVTYYTLSNATDNSVTFTTVDYPEANTPYLIGLTAAGKKEFSAKDVTTIPANQTEVSTSAKGWTMTGTYIKAVKTDDDNAYGFSGGQLYRNTGTMTVNPFRAYFTTASSNAKAVMDVEFGNTPTAINNLENGSFEFNEVYNLNGVRQNSLQNGVNIVKMANGKTIKVIIK